MITLPFKPAELDMLTGEYRLALEPSPDRNLSLPAAGLLDKDASLAYLDRANAVFGAKSRMGAASLFAKRYGCLTVASSLYAMSAFNIGMNYGVDNCHIESAHKGRAWLPKLRLDDWRASQPGEAGRPAWRDGVIRSVFADNLSRVWDALSKAVPIPKAILWENTAIYVYWLYEGKFEQGVDAQTAARIREDYAYLLRGAPGELFGEANNPLARFDSPKVTTAASPEPLRLRKTCCFYYETTDEPRQYCPSCPKLRHEGVVRG